MFTVPETFSAPFFAKGAGGSATVTLARSATPGVTQRVDSIDASFASAASGNSFDFVHVHPDTAAETTFFSLLLPSSTTYLPLRFPGGIHAPLGYGLKSNLTVGATSGIVNAKGYAMQNLPETLVLPSFEYAASAAAGGQAQISVSAVAGKCHVIDWLAYSLNDDPDTLETLTIAFDGTTKWEVDIPATGGAGEDAFPFPPNGFYTNTPNEALTITLSGNGSSADRTVNARIRTMNPPADTIGSQTLYSKLNAAAGAAIDELVAAVTGTTHVLDWMTISYDLAAGAPIVASVEIPDATAVWQQLFPATFAGPKHITFPGGLYGSAGDSLAVYLSGTAGKTGKMNFGYR